MHDPYRLSLVEQKKQQWAKEKEEMVGLSGLWGQRGGKSEISTSECKAERRSSLLPPIQGKHGAEDAKEDQFVCRPEEESETSGYLSDSPKHSNEERQVPSQQTFWSENKTSDDYWAQRKMYKNFKNETWAQNRADSWMRQQGKASWFGTPESLSSDDGRAKWGDRGIGVGHLWEPVTHQPESRLPQVNDMYRTPPKWVERGLKQCDGNQPDILVIHHSDEEENKTSSENDNQKNFLLGQNAPLPPDIMEERERKRRKAQEHQNAIRKQLEDRERKRKEEKEMRMQEERMEEERIRREQELERLRYEDEHKRNREKEEKERRKEEAMKEALENAEKLAQAAKKKPMRKQVSIVEESVTRLEREKKRMPKTPRGKSLEEVKILPRDEGKYLRDSYCQFEPLEGGLSSGMQIMNVNNLPMEGGLALVLDTPQAETNLLMSSDGVQLALLMSPGNHGQLIPLSLSSSLASSQGRVLTPSKYRGLPSPRHKSTQTDRRCCSGSTKYLRAGSRRHCHRSGRNSRYSDSSEKSNSLERPRGHAHSNCHNSNRFRSRSQPRLNLDDRPKWGINRPAVQYKKQSEKDPYYHRRLLKMKQKKVEPTEKLLESDFRLLKFETDEEEVSEIVSVVPDSPEKECKVLLNGFRMTSNPSSPRFVRISNEEPVLAPLSVAVEIETKAHESNEMILDEITVNEENATQENIQVDTLNALEDAQLQENSKLDVCGVVDDTEVVDDEDEVLTKKKMKVIDQITALQQGLKKLQQNIPPTRCGTPYSEHGEVSS